MKLTVCNGSPRGTGSNTGLLLEHFITGFEETAGNSHELFHLNRSDWRESAAKAFGGAETVLLAYPLYTDAMPGIVKEFLERLACYRGRPHNPRLLFLVQSGFPEGSHTSHVPRYHEKLARRLGCDYVGTIRRGGIEGIRAQPPSMNRKLFGRFMDLGRGFGRDGRLDEGLLAKLRGRERMPRPWLW
ncbi:MAG: NAD(P)H-dependent oxidoreductase, partial [Candidatus Eisenbacteria bacterium]|nr:NAD(P)H-dependent oxidoreductase [Candidatus Eisenbacteria bacterium]